MSSIKPLILHAYGPSANPVKVGILLEELAIPHTIIRTPYSDIKSEPYTSLNPNGRLPALEDPNTGITLFESGAILEYLVETYDKENKLHYPANDGDAQRFWLQKSWLHFQMSGQGPYFGQYVWFNKFHPEKNITSAIDRYANEIKRVSGVIEAHLKKQGTPYLLGDKVLYVDLAFVSWYWLLLNIFFKDWDYKTELPVFAAWIDSLMARPSIKAVYAKEGFQQHQ